MCSLEGIRTQGPAPPLGGPEVLLSPFSPEFGLLAHSAHLCTARSRVEVSTRGLHQTCAYPWSTFPENLAQLRPLLPGVTPGLSAEFGIWHILLTCRMCQKAEFGGEGGEKHLWAPQWRSKRESDPRGLLLHWGPEVLLSPFSPEIWHLAHSAHLHTVRRRGEQCTRGLHQTWPYPWSTFPENLAELRPLLPGVTPGLFVSQGNRDQGSCCSLGGKNGDDSWPNFEGTYPRSPSRY